VRGCPGPLAEHIWPLKGLGNHDAPFTICQCLLPFLSPKNQEYVALPKSARAKGFGDDWEPTSATCRGWPWVAAQFCAAGAFALGFESASLRKNRRPQRRKSALRLLVIIPVARAPRSLRLVAATTAGRGTNRGREPGFRRSRPAGPPFRLPPKVSHRGWKSRPRPFLFNDIPAFRSHLLCFHIHSSFGAKFSTPVLCFQ